MAVSEEKMLKRIFLFILPGLFFGGLPFGRRGKRILDTVALLLFP